MRKILVCFLLTFSVNVWANQGQNDSTKVNTDSIMIGNSSESFIDSVCTKIEKVIEEMKQDNAIIITKATRIPIGVLVLITGTIAILLIGIVVLLAKLFKKLKNIEYKYELANGKHNKYSQSLDILTEKVDKIAKNVETKKIKVNEDMKKVTEDMKNDIKSVWPNSQQGMEEKRSEKDETDENTENSSIPQKEKLKCVYAKPSVDGFLMNTEVAEDIYYVILIQEDNITGRFEIYKKEEQMAKAIKYKDMLDKFCETKGSSINAKSIRNIKCGEVKLIKNGIWKVNKKAEIEFIK